MTRWYWLILGIIYLAIIVLKIFGITSHPWWFILAPIWFPAVLAIIVITLKEYT